MDFVHMALDFVWLFTTVALIYLGFDSHQRQSLANRATTVSKSMMIVGGLFLALAVFHLYQDIIGAEVSLALHLTPLFVLSYAVYEYRRLIRAAELSV